jgi:hypothetical protein
MLSDGICVQRVPGLATFTEKWQFGMSKTVGERWTYIKHWNLHPREFRGSNSGWVEVFLTGQTCPCAHPASCSVGIGTFPGLKWPERGVDNPSLSSPEVKKHWRYISTPDLCLHGMLQVEYHVVQRLGVALPIGCTWDRVESHKVIITGWG